MTALSLLHQAALFAHLVAFAVAFATVLREDWRLLRTRRIDSARLLRAVPTVAWTLGALWASGLLLVGLTIAQSPGAWVPSDKLVAKLAVVSVLTANGWALHRLVFVDLRGSPMPLERASTPTVLVGAVSGASWAYAAFLGVARPLAAWLPLSGFLALYGLAVLLAVGLGFAFARGNRLAAA